MRQPTVISVACLLVASATIPISAAETAVRVVPSAASSVASSGSTRTAYSTYHFDNARTGWNPNETTLTTASVGSRRFGRVRFFAADSVVYAQPLYAPGILTGNQRHDLVILASENDTAYAYDEKTGVLVWKRTFVDPAKGVTAVPRESVNDCPQISPTIGISSTPVIDPQTQTLYLVDKLQIASGSTMSYRHELRALDLRTGADRVPPAVIGGEVRLGDATYATFNSQHQQNRPGLLRTNGRIYVAFGSACDQVPGDVHGWVFAYGESDLHSVAIYNTTASSANAALGSVWQSTYAPAADALGNIFLATGNGTFDSVGGQRSYGDSILHLSPALGVADFFAPKDNLTLSNSDQDVGSTGVMLLPDDAKSHLRLAVGGNKAGTMYLLDRDNLGGYDATKSHVLQELSIENAPNSLYGGPAYFPGYVYWGATGQPMQAFAVSYAPVPKLTPVSRTRNSFPGEGGEIPAVSSNGTQPGSAVVWATTRPQQGGTVLLYAYDARNLQRTLFSGVVGTWEATGDAFLTPTVVDGHVFVGGSYYGVVEFGLR